MILHRSLCIIVLSSFSLTSLTIPPVHAQSYLEDSSALPFQLPKPGSRVNLSPVFEPVLIKGLKVHP